MCCVYLLLSVTSTPELMLCLLLRVVMFFNAQLRYRKVRKLAMAINLKMSYLSFIEILMAFPIRELFVILLSPTCLCFIDV